MSSILFYVLALIVIISTLDQLQLNVDLLTSNVMIIVGGIVLAFAIGYGLSAREILPHIIASFYLKNHYRSGQRIRIGTLEGRIKEINNIHVVIENGEETIVIPANRLIAEEVHILSWSVGYSNNISNLTDQELVDKVLSGNARAFEVIYERYFGRVMRVCEAIVTDRETAKDLAQDAFIKMFDKLSSYHGKSALFTWMYPIARNVTYDYLRKKRPQDNIEDHESEFVADEPHDDELLSYKKDLLQMALQKVSATDRQLLVMKYGYSWSIEEIGEFMDLKEGAIKMRLMRAKSKVKEAYVQLNK